MKIYILTLFDRKITHSGRTVGYFESFEYAEKIVTNEMIWDHLFKYAVIEEVQDGLYPSYEENAAIQWYEVDDPGSMNPIVTKINKPDQFSNCYGWAIG